jgi:signal transduction histidine kinase
LEVFAEHAAVAIGNARLYEQERRTVERLEELDRLKSDFVATVSHELKTPLTAIIGAAGTLTRRAERLAPDQKADFLAMIERQGNRLLRLVEDVLVTARIESGSSRMHREPVDLRTLAEGVVADLSGTPSALGREVRIRCRPERPTVWANRGALHQVTLNLVENALKYSEPGTPVALTVTEDAEESTISVGDRGRGIAREELDAIFQRFRQVGTASTRSVEGFGLGLFIVESLVAAHNGRVEVVSERGVGSTFTVHLPNG